MTWRRLHNRVFSRYLLATNTIISCSLEGLSDYTEQRIEDSGYQDWSRTGRMMIMGILFGPIEHYWYAGLDRKLPGKSGAVIGKKVLLDEAVFGVSSLAIFFYGMALLEGRSHEESWTHMKNRLWPTYKISLLFWPIAQMINFYFLPTAYRVVYLNVLNYLWCIYLSYMQHKNHKDITERSKH